MDSSYLKFCAGKALAAALAEAENVFVPRENWRRVMRKPWLLIPAIGVIVACSACHHARIETEAKPSTITIEQPFASGWLFGLVPPKLLSTGSKCQHGLARVETQITFVNGLVRFLTLGIYTPMWIKVTCAEPGVARASTTVPDIFVGRGASEEDAARALQRAVQMALEENKPVLLQF
jgi:hypothetical protein